MDEQNHRKNNCNMAMFAKFPYPEATPRWPLDQGSDSRLTGKHYQTFLEMWYSKSHLLYSRLCKIRLLPLSQNCIPKKSHAKKLIRFPPDFHDQWPSSAGDLDLAHGTCSVHSSRAQSSGAWHPELRGPIQSCGSSKRQAIPSGNQIWRLKTYHVSGQIIVIH